MIEIKVTGYTLKECLEQILDNVPHKMTADVENKPVEPVAEPDMSKALTNQPKPVETPKKPVQKKAEEKKEEPAPAPAPVAEPAPAPATDTPVEITRDMAWEIATRVKNEVSLGALKLILGEFKAQKFAMLNPIDYAAFYHACEKRIAGGK